jgi:RNA polymerase sigma-70 factor (ECF subfamily)
MVQGQGNALPSGELCCSTGALAPTRRAANWSKRAQHHPDSNSPARDGCPGFPLIKMMDPTTKDLWERARTGDREAYDLLFRRHADRALLFIRARLGPRLREKVESVDVLQDAYLAAHRDFAGFAYTDEGAFLRWLCRIIDHRICDLGDHFGARKRQRADQPPSAPTGPSTALARAEHRAKVAAALDALSEDHRQVLLLRYFEGLSAEETGQRMGRSAGAVRKLAARALTELGKLV